MGSVTFLFTSLAAILGLTNARTRIVGGELADIKDFPYYVKIERSTDRYMWNNCGGALLNPRFVLTAYHCVKEIPKQPMANNYKSYRVFIAPAYSTVNMPNSGPFARVENIIAHPKAEVVYNEKGSLSAIRNDIAIIKLVDEPFDLPAFYPKLPTTKPKAGLRGTVVGLGDTKGQYTQQVPLLKLTEEVQNESLCRRLNKVTTEGALCVISDAGAPATCGGDSGGPFVVQENGSPTIYGVVSFGPTLCQDYSMFTNVYKYASWVEENTKLDED